MEYGVTERVVFVGYIELRPYGRQVQSDLAPRPADAGQSERPEPLPFGQNRGAVNAFSENLGGDFRGYGKNRGGNRFENLDNRFACYSKELQSRMEGAISASVSMRRVRSDVEQVSGLPPSSIDIDRILIIHRLSKSQISARKNVTKRQSP
jgi:hypothetical protein